MEVRGEGSKEGGLAQRSALGLVCFVALAEPRGE